MGTSSWMLIAQLTVIICFAGSKRLGVLLTGKWVGDSECRQAATYREWSQQDPAYQRVKVSGEPAFATRGPGKKQVCVHPNPPNLNSLILPCYFDFVSSPIFA